LATACISSGSGKAGSWLQLCISGGGGGISNWLQPALVVEVVGLIIGYSLY